MLRIKICCMQSADEVRIAVAHGATALGFVSEMPSGPGPVPEPLITSLVAGVPADVRAFLLTSKVDASAIIAQVRRTRVGAVQICDRLMIGSHRDLKAALPDVAIVQVIHVESEKSVHEAVAVADEVDELLLDSGRPAASVKELGGTGRVHDWALSRRIREAVHIPVWLAGGLTASNVAQAVALVRPAGVDVCSGVRTGGVLDPAKLAAFVQAARTTA
jgi:phosphoribosylanthranilate isomerase